MGEAARSVEGTSSLSITALILLGVPAWSEWVQFIELYSFIDHVVACHDGARNTNTVESSIWTYIIDDIWQWSCNLIYK